MGGRPELGGSHVAHGICGRRRVHGGRFLGLFCPWCWLWSRRLGAFWPAWAADANLPSPESETAAERGYRWLTTKPYIPVAHDQDVFDELWRVWEEPAALAGGQGHGRRAPQDGLLALWPDRIAGRPGPGGDAICRRRPRRLVDQLPVVPRRQSAGQVDARACRTRTSPCKPSPTKCA